MPKFRISYTVDTTEIGDVIKGLTPEQIATMQLVPADTVGAFTGPQIAAAFNAIAEQQPSQKALRKAYKAVGKKARKGKDIPTASVPYKRGGAADLMAQMIARANGEVVRIADINAMLEKRGLAKDTSGMRRLIELGLVKRVRLGEYVWAKR